MSWSSEDVFIKTNMFTLALHLQKASSRHLDQDQYLRLGHTSSRRLQDVFKTSSRRLQDVLQKRLQDIFKMPSRRFKDDFKTSSRYLQDILPRRLQHVFRTSSRRLAKTSSRHLQDIFKTFWRRLQDVLQRYLQDIFKTYHQVKLFLLTRLREVFNTFLRRSFPKTVIYRGISLCNTTSEKFMVSVQNLQVR